MNPYKQGTLMHSVWQSWHEIRDALENHRHTVPLLEADLWLELFFAAEAGEI